MPTQTRLNGPSRLNTPPSSNGVGPTQPANGRGNSFLQDRLREQTQAGTCAMPSGDYVTMEADGKAKYLAELFRTPEAQTTFNDRGFNGSDQSQLAAIMQNEGGTNERRRMLGSQYATAARSLSRKLAAGGYTDMARLDGAEQDRRVQLSEEERAVLTAAQSGGLDLAALNGSAGPSKDRASEALTNVGINHQTALYDEYSALEARQRNGEKLGTADRSRLTTLARHGLGSSGDFSDARGMSSNRFRSIYDEGQTRFEPSRYARSRDAIERWTAGGERGNGSSVGAGSESASSWVSRHPEARTGNHDALADAETSWGTAQIMGHYADRENLHNAKGGTFTMDDMRAAGARRSPNTTDVDMQISYFRDIANVPGHLGSADELAVQYNGPAAPPSYAQGIRDNAGRYDRARGALAPCPPGPLSALDGPQYA